MKTLHILILTFSLFLLAERVDARVLYGSTAAGEDGELYILDATTGAVIQDIGPLNDVTGQNYGITGLAFHPVSQVLYGSVANNNTATRAQLVTIDPQTALVTVIGLFNAGNPGTNPATMTDLSFDTAGNLYGIGSVGGPQLYSINIVTGQATIVGDTGLTSSSGGGLAISSADVFYSSPTLSRFGTYDSTTGAFTNIVNPTKPVGGAYAALAFDGSVLYGLNLGPDSAGKPTELVTFDPATGDITDLGASVPLLDAIAFTVPEPSTVAMLFVAALVGVQRRKNNSH